MGSQPLAVGGYSRRLEDMDLLLPSTQCAHELSTCLAATADVCDITPPLDEWAEYRGDPAPSDATSHYGAKRWSGVCSCCTERFDKTTRGQRAILRCPGASRHLFWLSWLLEMFHSALALKLIRRNLDKIKKVKGFRAKVKWVLRYREIDPETGLLQEPYEYLGYSFNPWKLFVHEVRKLRPRQQIKRIMMVAAKTYEFARPLRKYARLS